MDYHGSSQQAELTGKRVVSYGCYIKSDFSFTCDNIGTISGFFIGGRKYAVKSSLISRFNAYNITGAIAICVKLGIPVEVVIEALTHFVTVPGRLEVLITANNISCYVDYAHTDDALKCSLIALKGINPSALIVVFGCGGDRDKTKRPRMGKVASEEADVIIITDDNPRIENSGDIINDILSGIVSTDSIKVVSDRKKAISYAVSIATSDDIILTTGKGYEDY